MLRLQPFLVGGFNPSEKYYSSQIGSFPQVGVKIKKNETTLYLFSVVSSLTDHHLSLKALEVHNRGNHSARKHSQSLPIRVVDLALNQRQTLETNI